MFGDLIPLPIDSSCPKFTSTKVGQEQGATTERQAASRGAKRYHAARHTDKSDTRVGIHTQTDPWTDDV